jgi:hypothetical protein
MFAIALIVYKEESLVFDYRTADIRAVQVESDLRLGPAQRRCPAMRIQVIISKKFPASAMKLLLPLLMVTLTTAPAL